MDSSMKKNDEAMSISKVNSRLVAAIYFGSLAILAAIIIDTLLYIVGVVQIIPMYQTILLAAIVASAFGALFANKIIHLKKPYKNKAFWWGFLMVIAAVPVYNLGLVVLMVAEHSNAFQDTSTLQLISLYFISLLYLYLIVGLWLAIVAGFASIYLRSRLVYDILHSQNQERELPVEKKTKMHRSTTPHRRKPDDTLD